MTNSHETMKPISVPKRAVHDWDNAVMRHCDYCSYYAMTVQDNEGAAICAECCDATHVGNLESALNEAIKRNAELSTALEQTQTERDNFKLAFTEWHDKTEWVQEQYVKGRFNFAVLGMHRADVMKQLIEEQDAALERYKKIGAQPFVVKLIGGSLKVDGNIWYKAKTVAKLIRAAGGQVEE